MRLAQLARSLGEKTFTVREELSKKFDIDFEKGPNTKLEEEHVAYINEMFAKPEPQPEPEVEQEDEPREEIESVVPAVEEEVPPPTAVTEVKATTEEADLTSKTVAQLKEIAKAKGISGISKMKKAELIEAIAQEESPSQTIEETAQETPQKVDLAAIKRKEGVTTIEDFLGRPEPEFPDLPKPEDAETIRAPKIELEGIKVVDKIELPEPPKPKEKEEEKSEEKEPRKPRNDRNRNRNKSRNNGQRRDSRDQKDRKPKKKQPVNKAPSKQDLQRQKFEESYKPKQKQVKGKKKKTVKKKVAAEKAKAQEVPVQQEEIKNPKKTALGKFWWWMTNG